MTTGDTADPITVMLVTFADRLRAAGLRVGTGDVLGYCRAIGTLDPTDLVDLYWAGRTALLTGRDQIAVYDREFRIFFLDEPGDLPEPLRPQVHGSAELSATLEVPATEPGTPGPPDDQAVLGLVASAAQALRTKDFTACTPEELAALRRIMGRIRTTPPLRHTRRTVRARSGPAPDLRRTLRETMRRHGDPPQLFRRRRSRKPRPVVLILDVSGSMADYSRALLQFAHSAVRSTGRVEVFCFGTHLTRLTTALRRRRPDDALASAAATVADWEGGTRIGHCLDLFVRTWGRRGICRGALVVICSDGLDRGDPRVLDDALQRLRRLSHRMLWVDPHLTTGPGRSGGTLALAVAQPHLDAHVPGGDLRSLEALARLLPTV